VDADGALALLKGIADLYVAKGKKTVHFDLANARPSDEEILKHILGRSGTLRAPAIRKGFVMVVGFNSEVLSDTLL
jgi:arsenate reductase-like glutaredoxin family protein